MKKHLPTANELIMSKAILSGLSKKNLAKDIAKKTGMSEATVRRRFRDGDWNLHELAVMDRWIHFEPDDLPVLLSRDRR